MAARTATASPNRPWEILEAVGTVSLGLGVLSVLHSISEAGQVWIQGRLRQDLTLLMMLLDVPVALLWLQSGRALRNRREGALLLTVIAAGMALIDSVIAAFLMVPMMKKDALHAFRGEDEVQAAILFARCLLYEIHIVYSPVALVAALIDYDRRLPQIYRRYTREFLWFALVVAVFSWGLIQFLIKGTLMRFI